MRGAHGGRGYMHIHLFNGIVLTEPMLEWRQRGKMEQLQIEEKQ